MILTSKNVLEIYLSKRSSAVRNPNYRTVTIKDHEIYNKGRIIKVDILSKLLESHDLDFVDDHSVYMIINLVPNENGYAPSR